MTSPDIGSLAESGKAARVREMFAEIASRYDFLNHALSLNIDRRWRRLTVKKLARALERPGARALDLCCGTGDLAIELAKNASTWGLDFCHPMLEIGSKKIRAARIDLPLVEGDALRTPFQDASFDAVTMAFGLRNLADIRQGLAEVHRLLRPGGRAGILEFSHPTLPVLSRLFRMYFTRILPRLGNAISGSNFAYQYLPESVRTFPNQQALAELLGSVGFSNVEYYNLSGGIVALHVGDKE